MIVQRRGSRSRGCAPSPAARHDTTHRDDGPGRTAKPVSVFRTKERRSAFTAGQTLRPVSSPGLLRFVFPRLNSLSPTIPRRESGNEQYSTGFAPASVSRCFFIIRDSCNEKRALRGAFFMVPAAPGRAGATVRVQKSRGRRSGNGDRTALRNGRCGVPRIPPQPVARRSPGNPIHSRAG